MFIIDLPVNKHIMMNDEIQYTGKFDILTYPLGTNSVVVMSPDCIVID
jgi:4-hydroxy-L-threonine phosphate dehydrogenase PdxA